MRKSPALAIILLAVSTSMMHGCSQHSSTPVVASPEVTTQPSDANRKSWLGRTADATWDVASEPAGWFKSAPKEPKKSAQPQPTEPPEPVQIIIVPRNPGVIETEDAPATQPGQ